MVNGPALTSASDNNANEVGGSGYRAAVPSPVEKEVPR